MTLYPEIPEDASEEVRKTMDTVKTGMADIMSLFGNDGLKTLAEGMKESFSCKECGQKAKLYFYMIDPENFGPAMLCPSCTKKMLS